MRFGFSADSGRDGFTGGGHDGDYFLPGTAEEGFGVRVGGTIYNNNERDSAVGFPASVNSSSIDGGVASVPWDGTVDGLGIQKVSRVSEIGLFIQSAALPTLGGISTPG